MWKSTQWRVHFALGSLVPSPDVDFCWNLRGLRGCYLKDLDTINNAMAGVSFFYVIFSPSIFFFFFFCDELPERNSSRKEILVITTTQGLIYHRGNVCQSTSFYLWSPRKKIAKFLQQCIPSSCTKSPDGCLASFLISFSLEYLTDISKNMLEYSQEKYAIHQFNIKNVLPSIKKVNIPRIRYYQVVGQLLQNPRRFRLKAKVLWLDYYFIFFLVICRAPSTQKTLEHRGNLFMLKFSMWALQVLSTTVEPCCQFVKNNCLINKSLGCLGILM